MERSSNGAPMPEQRLAVCPAHGEYESRLIVGRIWSQCEACVEASHRQEREAAQRDDERRQKLKRAERLQAANIPERFVGRTLEAFNEECDGQRRAKTIVRDYVDELANNIRHGQGLIFSGMPGCGKTHLATAVLQAALPRQVAYVTCLDMIREVRSGWRRNARRSDVEVLEALGSDELLVIDEVGVQYGTEGEQTIVFDVIDRRYRNVLPTILVTNLNRDELVELLGERAFDRLRETCRWVTFDWPSYRPQARRDAPEGSRLAAEGGR